MIVLELLLLSKLLVFVRLASVAGVFGSSVSANVYFVPNGFIINLTGMTTTAFAATRASLYVGARGHSTPPVFATNYIPLFGVIWGKVFCSSRRDELNQ